MGRSLRLYTIPAFNAWTPNDFDLYRPCACTILCRIIYVHQAYYVCKVLLPCWHYCQHTGFSIVLHCLPKILLNHEEGIQIAIWDLLCTLSRYESLYLAPSTVYVIFCDEGAKKTLNHSVLNCSVMLRGD